MTDRTYCSDLCLASGEPMLGTADRVDVWLLLEYRPVWKRKAVDDNDLSDAVGEWLQRAVAGLAERGLKARPQFIRRPELDVTETSFFVASQGALYEYSTVGYEAFLEIDVASSMGSDGRKVATARYFVCTNGQRDMCCARYGLPTYASLRDQVGDRVWQTTHLGGHRFAPNVLALPQGVLYGRVFPEDVGEFLEAVENGRLSRRHVRGRSVYSPAGQAAEVLIDEDVLEVVSVDGTDTCAQVLVRTERGERTIAVERDARAWDVLASCKDEETKPIFPYRETGTSP